MTQIYFLGLAGESNYQPAIKRCSVLDRVKVCHEPDNPYDNLALRVESRRGEVIGYVPKSSWLRTAIHDEGKGVTATIKSISRGEGAHLGVVLNVTLTDDEIWERSYQQPAPKPRSFLSRLLW